MSPGHWRSNVAENTVQKIKDSIASSDLVILHAIMEVWSPDAIAEMLLNLGVDQSQNNITFLFEEGLPELGTSQLQFTNSYPYNHGLMKTNASEEVHGFNSTINLQTGKFLYLMGKPYKQHRIGLLHQLFKHRLLENCDWSFSYNSSWDGMLREALPLMSEQEYQSFVNRAERTLDEISTIITDEVYYYSGFPTDSQLYANTSFSVISETNCDVKYWSTFTTEKTWRTISNHHAFVMIAYKKTYDYLESIGIDTFQYALKHTKEAMHHDQDVHSLNKLTAENVEYFLAGIDKNSERIRESIENNKKVYEQRVHTFRSVANPMIEPILLTPYFQVEPLTQLTV